MNIFSQYIKNIAVCIIFSAFIQMLLPNNNFRKYIDLVLGFIIIIIVLNPIVKVFSNDYGIDYEVFSMDSRIKNAKIIKQKEVYSEGQKEVILDAYKAQIHEQIKNLIAQNIGMQIKSIDLEVDEDYDSSHFASIKKLSIYVENDEQTIQDSQEVIYIEKIKKVSIQPEAEQNNKPVMDRDTQLEKKIETLISDFYKLDKDNIYIIVHRT